MALPTTWSTCFRLLQLPQAWRSAHIETLRARLFKLGARVRQTARCIRVHLATGWPWQSLSHELALGFHTGQPVLVFSEFVSVSVNRVGPCPKMFFSHAECTSARSAGPKHARESPDD
jgi:hypothetical protein